MNAIFKKDLRENLKLALLGLIILAGLLYYDFQPYGETLKKFLEQNWSGQIGNLQPLLSMSLLTGIAFFCAIFGAGLGWLQTRNEAQRDLWAFLIHRPVTRSEIFWAKTAAGLCLYTLGAGLPLVCLLIVVQTPGFVAAPFEWAMTSPLVSLFLSGVAFYFAGLLTGLRQARWFGSRWFGWLGALAASFAAFGLPNFGISQLLSAITIAILALAAWGCYQSGGFYRGQPLAGRLALTVTLAVGCFGLLGFGSALLIDVIFGQNENQSYKSTMYTLTRNGTVCIVTDNNGQFVSATDLEGHPLPELQTGKKLKANDFYQIQAYGGMAETRFNHPQRSFEEANNIQNPSRFFSLCMVADKTLWYLDRHGKITGYDGRTRKCVGHLAPPDDSFLPPQKNWDMYYHSVLNSHAEKKLPSAKSVYLVNFRERTMKCVFTLTNDDEIGDYSEEPYEKGPEGIYKREFFFTTRQTVGLLDHEGHPIFSIPYQPAYSNYPQVSILHLIGFPDLAEVSTNPYAVIFHPDYQLNRKAGGKMPEHVAWLGGSNLTVTKSLDLPPLPAVANNDDDDDLPSAIRSTLGNLVTSLMPPFAHIDYNQHFFHGFTKPWNLFSYAVGILCAALTRFLARRYNFPAAAAFGWTLFVLLLGLTGLFTFLCVQEWPARVPCPACRKRRTVDRATCEHCQAPFGPPATNGTEIFAPLVKG